MDVAERLVQRNHLERLHQIGRQSLGNFRLQALEKRCRKMLDGARIQSRTLHLVGCVVIRLHPHGIQPQAVRRLHVRVGDVDSPVESVGTPEYNVIRPRLISRHHILYPIEPHQIHDTLPVREVGNQAALPSLALHVEAQNLPPNLHVGHISRQFMHVIEPRAVNMLVGKAVKQVMQCADMQLIRQEFGPFRSYARQVFHILVFKVHHLSQSDKSASATFKSNGVVILMFSRLPRTNSTSTPMASTTEASSVKAGEYSCP